jgi:hypothetical protein
VTGLTRQDSPATQPRSRLNMDRAQLVFARRDNLAGGAVRAAGDLHDDRGAGLFPDLPGHVVIPLARVDGQLAQDGEVGVGRGELLVGEVR